MPKNLFITVELPRQTKCILSGVSLRTPDTPQACRFSIGVAFFFIGVLILACRFFFFSDCPLAWNHHWNVEILMYIFCRITALSITHNSDETITKECRSREVSKETKFINFMGKKYCCYEETNQSFIAKLFPFENWVGFTNVRWRFFREHCELSRQKKRNKIHWRNFLESLFLKIIL